MVRANWVKRCPWEVQMSTGRAFKINGVNNIEVMNFKNPLDCSSKNIDTPKKYTGKFFIPSVCELE
jgi:hypothetical protein